MVNTRHILGEKRLASRASKDGNLPLQDGLAGNPQSYLGLLSHSLKNIVKCKNPQMANFLLKCLSFVIILEVDATPNYNLNPWFIRREPVCGVEPTPV